VNRLALITLILGCNPLPLTVYDERYGESEPYQQLPVEVEEACQIWQMECVAENESATVILLVNDDPSSSTRGFTITTAAPCSTFTWVEVDPFYIAHELGHVMGLGHSDDKKNLMAATVGFTNEITERQLNKVHRVAGRVAACP
jgi:hypothetical protein